MAIQEEFRDGVPRKDGERDHGAADDSAPLGPPGGAWSGPDRPGPGGRKP
ncbi:MAG TPA: hypothetical protein VKP68_14415 [Ramlibacter sp.]|nr:hypothetical protein [Ramlibacter sp.]